MSKTNPEDSQSPVGVPSDTQAHPRQDAASRYPFGPYPRGWFRAAYSDELAAGDLKTLRFFGRESTHFSIPTKLGVFGTPPYFHDHGPLSLRALLDPEIQTSSDPTYGDAAYSDGIARGLLTWPSKMGLCIGGRLKQ